MLFGRKTDPRRELRRVLGDYELPSFSGVVLDALDRLRDDDAPLSDAAEVIGSDPGLTARLLGTVNSAAYGLRHGVSNVNHAAALLGRNQIESMLITLAVRDNLPRNPVPGFDNRRFWSTAALRAAAAKTLADRLHPATAAESFSAALLQDMALPLLAHEREDYRGLLIDWHSGDDDLADLERAEFTWDHGVVAGLLCAQWGMPEILRDAIVGHHADPDPQNDPLPAVSLVAPLREVNEEIGRERLIEDAHGHFGLPYDETSSLLSASDELAAETARLFC